MSKPLHKPAFTLIEVMVVVVIIALLTALATTNYLRALSRARDGDHKANVNAIASAVEAYYATYKVLPGKVAAGLQGTPEASGLRFFQPCESQSETSATPGNYRFSYLYFYHGTNLNCDQQVRNYVQGSPGNPAGVSINGSRYTYTNPSTGLAYSYDQQDYAPSGVWIPGLGPYLNPFPIDKAYAYSCGTIDATCSTVGTPSSLHDPLRLHSLTSQSCPSSQISISSYFYRKLQNSVTGQVGYIVYTPLENQAPDATTCAQVPDPSNLFRDLPSDNYAMNPIYMVLR